MEYPEKEESGAMGYRDSKVGACKPSPARTTEQILKGAMSMAAAAENEAGRAESIANDLFGPNPEVEVAGMKNVTDKAQGVYECIIVAHRRTDCAIRRIQSSLNRIEG